MGFDNPPRPWAELEKLLSWRGTGQGTGTGRGTGTGQGTGTEQGTGTGRGTGTEQGTGTAEEAGTAKHYGVAPGTVQRVMRKLAEDGLVRVVVRWGTFKT